MHTLKLLNSPTKIVIDCQENLFAVYERKIPVSGTSRGQYLNAWLHLQSILFLVWVGSDSANFINLTFHCCLQQKTDRTEGSDTRMRVGMHVRVCITETGLT